MSIGDNGSCFVIAVNETSIACTIVNAPSGTQNLRVTIVGYGLASSNENFTVNVSLVIDSFDPVGGLSGGGYQMTILGGGFSPNVIVMVGENYCRNLSVDNFTIVKCIVPPSSSDRSAQVAVTVIDGFQSVRASRNFEYNVTNTTIIYGISPTFTTVIGGLLNITGTGFDINDVAVFVDGSRVQIVSLSNNYILVNLSPLPPGIYPIMVRTSTGFARPLFNIEYRFYIQEIWPHIGSAYGGTDIYVNGDGFVNGTRVQLRDSNNQLFPCNIISIQLNQIHCQTTSFSNQAIITSNGIHPTYGFGYAWLPIRLTIAQSTNVTWYWDSSQLSTPVYYKIQQVQNESSTEPVQNGFDSGQATRSGK